MFFYRVEFWDEIDKEVKNETGILVASTYSDATERLINYYGEGSINQMTLTPYDDVLTKEEVMEGFNGI